jgi:Ca2+-binding RTX toxin-like protein
MKLTESFPLKKWRRQVMSSLMLVAAACGNASDDELPVNDDYRGVEAAAGNLTGLATPCAFDTTTGIATVTVAATEVAVISKRVVDAALLVNGQACQTAAGNNIKKITVTGSTGAETVVVDYSNGTFANGSPTAAGIDIDLKGGTDTLGFRGTALVDTIAVGAGTVPATGVGAVATNADSNSDVTFAGVEALTFSLGAGADTFTGQGGKGTGAAYSAALTVFGGVGADKLTGGAGGDTLHGNEDADTIAGDLGADTITGDEADDTIDEGTVTNGADTINCGVGTGDTVSYANRTLAVTVTIGAGSTNDGQTTPAETDDVPASCENVKGGGGADSLTGDGNDNVLSGGAGDDTLLGGLGNDTLNGEAGNDTFNEGSASNGADVFNGGAGTDHVNYGSRTQALTVTMDGSAGDGEVSENDNVKSDVENLTGGTAADTLTGNALNNVLTGGLQADVLNGLAGDDTFAEGSVTNGGDTFNGGTGTDLVDYGSRVAVITATMADGLANDGLGSETDNISDDVENINTGTGNDVITGNDLGNVINTGNGDDTVHAGLGNDTISGGNGDDDLFGEGGDDYVDGDDDSDSDGTYDKNDIDCGGQGGDIGAHGTIATNSCQFH